MPACSANHWSRSLDTPLAVVEEGCIHVALLPEGYSVSAVFGAADDFAGVVGAGDGAADLVKVVGLGSFCFIKFVKKAKTVNVVGSASVGMIANQQTALGRIRIGHIARGSRGTGDGSPDSSKCMTSYPNWPVDVIVSQPK